MAAGFWPLDGAWYERTPAGALRVDLLPGAQPCVRGRWTNGHAQDLIFLEFDNCPLPDALLQWADHYQKGGGLPKPSTRTRPHCKRPFIAA